MSANHLESTVVFSSLTACWNHLGNFKNSDTWVSPRDSDLLAWDVAWASAPHVVLMDGQLLPSEDASC